MRDTAFDLDTLALLGALPAGVCVYDPAGRLTFVNDAYCDILRLPRGVFLPSSEFEANVRMIALHGVYGAGDPERHVRELLAVDRASSSRRRYRRMDGGTIESQQRPLPDGSFFATLVDTTALVEQREQAERTASSLFQVVSNLRAGLAVFDAERKLLLHNWRFQELLGVAGPNLAPGLPFEAVLQAVRDHVDADLRLTSGGSAGPEMGAAASTERLRIGGRVVDLAADPLAGGGWSLTVTDVTALFQAEEEATRRAAMLEAMIEHIPHGIIVYGPDRRLTTVNPTYLRVMEGATAAVGEHLDEIRRRRAYAGEYGPGDPDVILAERSRLNPRAPQSRRRRRPNGTVLELRSAPLPDGGHISVVTDVTALTDAEDELGRTARHMQAMLANIRHGIVLWDQHRRVIACNAAVEQMLHTPPGFLRPGLALEALIENADQRGNLGAGPERLARTVHLATQDRTKSHFDRRITSHGQVLDVRSDPVEGGGFITTYTDVTESQHAQVELAKAKAAAEAANVAKSRFLATMSHELRTPLNAVIGFSESLMRAAADAQVQRSGRSVPALDPARIAEQAESVHAAGRRLLTTIDTILDVARLDAGRFDVVADRVDLRPLIAGCVRRAAAVAAAGEIGVSADLPADLPVIEADERRVGQALLHLLTNAIKFTEAPGTVAITVDVAPEGGPLRLVVTDTGIGMPASDLERACEPFTQLDASLARRFEGTGLGLYITRAIMQAHDGALELESAPCVGTVATLRFPPHRVLRPSIHQEIV